jgi:hypothetical protein
MIKMTRKEEIDPEAMKMAETIYQNQNPITLQNLDQEDGNKCQEEKIHHRVLIGFLMRTDNNV